MVEPLPPERQFTCTSRMQNRGRLGIPRVVRDELDLRTGDVVEFKILAVSRKEFALRR